MQDKALKTIQDLDKLTNHCIILTPNQRLSYALQHTFNQQRQACGATLWPTPNILPWQTWLFTLWQQLESSLQTMPWLLSAEQSQLLWLNIVKQQNVLPLLNLEETSRLAFQSYQLIQQYRVPMEHPDWHSMEESQLLHDWSMQYKGYCQNNKLCDQSDLCEWLIHTLKNYPSILPECIVLASFDDLPPHLNYLLDALRSDAGCEIIRYESKAQHAVETYEAFDNFHQELQAMLAWSRAMLEEGHEQIGCVVPDLQNQRALIERVCSHIFDAPTAELPYNISAGYPLHEYPIIQTLFICLQSSEDISLETLHTLARSPFIKDAEQERLARAELPQWAIAKRLTHCRAENLPSDVPIFKELAEKFQTTLSALPKTQMPSQWAHSIMSLLDIWGWPGERSLNSAEYQVVKRFHQVLNDFSQLDSVVSHINFSDAIRHLKLYASLVSFQIQSPQAPIQILGTLEAAGLEFDKLWICQMDQDHFPQPPNPNPLIPITLQKKYRLPHVSVEKEQKFSETMLSRFRRSTPSLHYSYHQQEQQRILRPSQLIAHATLSKQDCPKTCLPTEVWIDTHLEALDDEQGPHIVHNEAIHGGSQIFKHQAQCPFQAFAIHRLNAYPNAEISYGIDSIDRGIVIHHSMEIIWQKKSSQSQLAALNENQRLNFIEDCVQQAINDYFPKIWQKNHDHLLDIEKKVVTKLIAAWCQIELARPYFKIYGLEEKLVAEFEGIPLKLRMDRIDSLGDDQYLLIDYKTGLCDIQSWLDERPDEPQLLLYLMLSELPIEQLAFAQIHKNHMGLKGISHQKSEIQGLRAWPDIDDDISWPEQKKQWGQSLQRLAVEFKHGTADIKPKYGAQTCRTCQLQALCRINEITETRHE